MGNNQKKNECNNKLTQRPLHLPLRLLSGLLILALALSLLLTACGNNGQTGASGSASKGNVTTESKSQKDDDALMKKIRNLDGVADVTKVEISKKNKDKTNFLATYVIEFVQLIDWNNPDLGTFTQRAVLGYLGDDNKVCYNTGGYILSDIEHPGSFETIKGADIIQGYYECNYVDMEYRFFGKSVPEGFSLENQTYWQYLTSENASRDFHHIITELSKIFSGKTFFTGVSKGGYSTENMAYYFPDDIDCYISRVAPLCDGTNDLRMLENAYNTIGDADPNIGQEKAAHYRKVLLEIQKLMLEERYRAVLQPILMSLFDGGSLKLSPLATEDQAYEVTVVEVGLVLWQTGKGFPEAEEIFEMPDSTEEEYQKRLAALEEFYLSTDPADNISYTTSTWQYYIQSYMEMGNYGMDFSYLRNAGAVIKTSAADESDLYMRLCCPSIVGSKLKYSGAHRQELIDFLNTTTKDIIKVYGLSDPWYAERAPETDNPHIHVFEVPGSHRAASKMPFSEEQTEEFHALVDAIMGEK